MKNKTGMPPILGELVSASSDFIETEFLRKKSEIGTSDNGFANYLHIFHPEKEKDPSIQCPGLVLYISL